MQNQEQPSPYAEAIRPNELSNKKETILADAILNSQYRFNQEGQLVITVKPKNGESVIQHNERTHTIAEALLEGIETKSAMAISGNKIKILEPSNNIMSILKELHIRVDNKENAKGLEKIGGFLQEENIKNIIDLAQFQRNTNSQSRV